MITGIYHLVSNNKKEHEKADDDGDDDRPKQYETL
jgi:hypothetical protein